MDLDVESSSISQLRSHCETCFPMMDEVVPIREKYVDLLEFSNFNGIPYPVIDSSRKPRRFLADFRYSWSLPLSHDYPLVEKEVLSSKRVHKVISRLKEQNDEQKNRAVQFFTEISARLSKVICRCCAYILYKVFRRLMDKLLVCKEEMNQLKQAEQTGIPIVYLPLHRSHLDYLLITWCNWHFGLKLPHIASGDNLNLSGLGWLLRATGAFFIRRRVDPDDERGKDQLYRAILHSYIEQVLEKNMPIEFFLEGTRSRFGKVLTPKNGLISNVVEAVQHGFIKDCYLVPVSYTYDAVVEGIFLHELMGIPKVRESVIGVFRAIFSGFRQSKQCGVVRMHYGRPILLTEYLATITASLSSHRTRPVRMTKLASSFSYRELVPWHRTHSETVDDRTMIRAIGFHVVYEAQMMCSISPVAVVSCLALAKWREKVSRSTFERDCEWLCENIISEGGDVVGYQSKKTKGKDLADYAFEKLKSCLKVTDEYNFPSEIMENFLRAKGPPLCDLIFFEKLETSHKVSGDPYVIFFLLIFRRPEFQFQDMFYTIVSRSPNATLLFDEIVEDTLSLCDWLQFEFLFCRPCDSLRELVHNVLSSKDWSHPIRGYLTSETIEEDGFLDAGDFQIGGTVRVFFRVRDSKSREALQFFANLVRPFIQSLYLVSSFVSSERCSTEPTSDNNIIRQLCQESLAGKISLPFSPLLESINSDSFKNGLRILKDKGLLQRSIPNSTARSSNSRLTELISNLERVLEVK
ncbi:Protein CBR-ACL-6 [Caenorhabditis briggsae]|uniref:Protein CBR-ACL-6 n=1 Tax=Caenorhabditis briggsae TaxID=6238 RepID=A8X974_CAEBR|nr:Protein CBR-ACL-6 [Caenorhabditis briggsae]CAP29186.2 Protein CBR-ACL-6 [Caenorhabditis briggsae]